MFNVRLIKAEGLRRVIVLSFYLAAFIASVFIVSSNADIAQKASCLIVFILLPFGLWFEYKRYIYVKSNHELNDLDQPQACLDHTRFVMKYDFLLKQYQNLAPFQEGYALIDLNQINNVESVLESRFGKKYEKSKNLNFEHSYLLFQTAALKKDQKKVKEYYQQLDKVFNAQNRLSKDLITLRHYIDGIYYVCINENSKALDHFENLDTEAFKRRELTYYYYFSAKAYMLDQNYASAESYYAKAKELSPNNTFIVNHPIHSVKTKIMP